MRILLISVNAIWQSLVGFAMLLCAFNVFADVYTPITLPSNALNTDITTWLDGSRYTPVMSGNQTFASVPFSMQTNASGMNVIWATSTSVYSLNGSTTYTNTVTLTANVYSAKTVYTLINLAYGSNGQTVGSITFNASDGTTSTVNLVVGLNVRDHYAAQSVSASYVTKNVYGLDNLAHLDMQAFSLPATFLNKTLTSIVFTTSGSPSTGIPFLAGATVQSSNANLIAYYAMDELSWDGSAGELKDTAGYSVGPFNGKGIGTPIATSTNTSPAISGATGTCGYASMNGTRFDGSAFQLDNLPVNTNTGAKTSISFWMYWDGGFARAVVGWSQYFLMIDSTTGRASVAFDTWMADRYGTSSVGLANGWHHVVAVFTNGDVSLNAIYIDGVKKTLSEFWNTNHSAANAVVQSTLIVGGLSYTNDYRFKSYVDEVKVYDGEVTQTQVTADYNATHTCPIYGTVANRFNCTVVGANSNTGSLYTQIASTPFNMDVIALQTSGAVETNYVTRGTKNVTLEVVDGSGATACGSRSALSPTVSRTVTFGTSDAGRKTVSTTINRAYRDLMCRVTDNNQTPSVVACSSDDFAVRPSNLTISTSNAGADATGASTTASPRIKAGSSFSLSATADVTGYDGTPIVDNTKVQAHSGAVATGTLAGSFGAAVASTGVATSNTFNYSEAGYFRLAANGVYDSTFTAVDSAKGDCATGFSASGGLNACSFGNTSTTNYFGRFIPDHFGITTGTNTEGCDSGNFTYFGQDGITTAFTLRAENASNQTTQNYISSFAKLGLTSWSNYNFSSQGTPFSPQLSASATSPTGTWVNGIASVTAKHQISRLSAMVPQSTKCADERSTCAFTGTRMVIYGANGIYTSGTFTNGVACSNNVFGDPLVGALKACYLANLPSPSAVTVFASPIDSDSVSMTSTAVSAASLFRYGRLSMPNVYGSELLQLTVPIEAQYWNGTAYQRNQLDSCSSVPASSIMMSTYTRNLAACETILSGAGALNNGVVNAKLSEPGTGNSGSVNLSINLSSASGNTCNSASASSATAANLPWFGTSNTSARETFGLYKTPIIYMRENF